MGIATSPVTVTMISKYQSLSNESKSGPELPHVIAATKWWLRTCQGFQDFTADKLTWLCWNLCPFWCKMLSTACSLNHSSAASKQIQAFFGMKSFLVLHVWCTFSHTEETALFFTHNLTVLENSKFGLRTRKAIQPKWWWVTPPSVAFTTESQQWISWPYLVCSIAVPNYKFAILGGTN